jgi:hypothetical protein
LLVECANTAEQTAACDGGPDAWMSKVLFWFALGRFNLPALGSSPVLAGKAEKAAIDGYAKALRLPATRAFDVLNKVVDLNPWAAEPRILRGLCTLEFGESPAALADAVRGRALATAWAIPWDRRMSLPHGARWLRR